MREASVTPTAVANYHTLMTATDQPYQLLGNDGVFRLEDQSILWISVKSLYQPWLHERLNECTVKQPLLMPVSIVKNEQQTWIDFLSKSNFTLTEVAGKALLKEVPADFRHLPWVRLFSAAAMADVQSLASLSEVLSTALIDSGDNSVANRVISWFLAQPAKSQTLIEQSHAETKSLQALTEWLSSES